MLEDRRGIQNRFQVLQDDVVIVLGMVQGKNLNFPEVFQLYHFPQFGETRRSYPGVGSLQHGGKLSAVRRWDFSCKHWKLLIYPYTEHENLLKVPGIKTA